MVSLRDENFDRATKVATYYPEENIIGSKDQDFSGMQIGVSLTGKIAAVTNLVGNLNATPEIRSRGLLVSDFLKGTDDNTTTNNDVLYKPFNLFCAMISDDMTFSFYRQWSKNIELMKEREIYGIDNEGLDTNCYRLNRAKELFQYTIINYTEKDPLIDNLFDMLNDKEPGMENDTVFKKANKMFLSDKIFGTRTQTIILINQKNKVTFVERNLDLDSLIDHDDLTDTDLPKEIKYTSGVWYYDSDKWFEDFYEFQITE